MVKLEHPGHGIFYVDSSSVVMVRNVHCKGYEDETVIYLSNNRQSFAVLGTVHEVMDKLGIKHE